MSLRKCYRCIRLEKPCSYGLNPRKGPTERLQERIHDLELEIQALSTPQMDPCNRILSHPLFVHNVDAATPTARAPRLLPMFPLPIWREERIRNPYTDSQEAYSSVLPREVVELALSHWDTTQEVPRRLSEYLCAALLLPISFVADTGVFRIRMFLPFRMQFLFHLDLVQFIDDLRLPVTHPRSIHPGLLNAMHLLACSVGGMLSYEGYFLERARKQLDKSLAGADRLDHFTCGSLLVGIYYRRSGRLVESYSE